MCTNAAALELCNSYANKRWNVYVAWVKTLIASVIFGSVCACLALFFFGPSVISVWTHGKVSVAGSLLVLFGFSVALQAASSVFYMLLYSSNQHHWVCYVNFAITIGALLVGDLMIGAFGFGSVPLLMICADSLTLGCTLFFCVRNLPDVRFSQLLEVLGPGFYIEKAAWLLEKARLLKLSSQNR
jgi:O-antigen/teichoic acid export membrane protein